MARTTPKKWKVALAIIAGIWVISFVGGIWQNHQLAKQEAQLQQILAHLATENSDFASLRVIRSSHPKVWIFGELKSQQEINRLQAEVAKQFGDAQANRFLLVRLPIEAASQPSGA